jgi:hypothetical protein
MKIRWICILAALLAMFLLGGCAHRVYTIGVDNPDNALELGASSTVAVKKLPGRAAFEYDPDIERKLARVLAEQGFEIAPEDDAEFFILYEYRVADKMAHMNLELLRGATEGIRTVRRGGPYVHTLEVRLVEAETYRDDRYNDSLIWEGGAVVGDVPTMSPKFHDMLVLAALEQLGKCNLDGDSVRMSLNSTEVQRLRQ